ncbi:membrane progestin receptor gamma-like [Haliotis rufescens]|uniref:membrane progestin receptor gamma-like n=1 Tax=Haliotis rufescens TaxID=6454 RepID=UPI001EAFF978|nr:membrane progestin receptor gamma-like [Haliotis rufescens]XP_046365794.1 membrane progestin receptor gamma-like [Haliotis rufescens]
MAGQSLLKKLTPTTTKKGIPKLFHEPHVETGFRHMHQPWTYYCLSFLQIHNECMNCWTHLLALIVTLVRVGIFWKEFDLIGDQYMWPLSAGLITMVILYICSTCAHCFSNKSELIHYTCFMVDYAGIGLYGLGSVILHHSYCFHDSLLNSALDVYSVLIGVFLSILVCVCCSISKTRYSRPYPFARRIWQLSSVFAVYIWLIFPVWHRVMLYMMGQEPWDDGMGHHIQQMMWFFSGGFFFGSDIPQRLFPGKFDFLGHSHQIFHVCIMMTSYKQLDGVYQDILRMKLSGSLKKLPPPTFNSTFGAVLFVICANLISVCIFRKIADWKIRSDRETEKAVKNGNGKCL